jgi:hypothetical protein
MINSILASDLLFVEDVEHFNSFMDKNKIVFKGETVKLSSPFNV